MATQPPTLVPATLPVPLALNSAEPRRTRTLSVADTDFSKVKEESGASKSQIEHAERQYKEFVGIRRIQNQPHLLFGGEAAAGSLSEIEQTAELIFRAKSELLKAKSQLAKENADRAKRETERDTLLKKKVKETKQTYFFKSNLLKAGPSCEYHFLSVFGFPVHVELLEDFIYLVFTHSSFIEVWTCECGKPDKKIKLWYLIQLPIDVMTAVCKLETEPVGRLLVRKTTVTEAVGGSMESGSAEGDPSQQSSSLANLLLAQHQHQQKSVLHDNKSKSIERFFVGCRSGQGIIVSINVAYNKELSVLMVDHSLEAVRRLSVHSIKSVVHCSATQQIVMIVSHVGPDHVVAAFDYGLKDVWQCRSEALRAIANEKQTKVISQETFDYPCSDKDKQSARPEYIVTAMCADEANKSILLAVKGGTLLRIAYERKKLNTDTDDSDPTLSQFKCDIFISWALDIQPARTTEFKDLASKKKANAQPINITSVCCFVNSTTNVSGLLIACDDGSVRHHSVSVTGLPEYVGKSLKRSEQEEGIGSMRGDAAYPIIVNAGTDMQFIMIFCNGMLYIYDIAEVEPMVELGILLDRSSKLSSDVKTRRLRRMSILHEKKGWIVLIAGKGWSIVNIEGLFGWRNIMKMEYKSPKSRKGQRSRASAKHIGQQDSVATQEGTEGGETVSALDSESGSSSEEDSETGDDTASVIPGDGEDVSKE